MQKTGPIALLLVAMACACSTAPAPTPRLAGATLTFGPDGPLPAADVDVPPFGVVVFRNALDRELEIVVDHTCVPSERCDTSIGFAAEGARAVARATPSGRIVSLCFHDSGTFGYLARSGDREWRGRIHVEAAR